INSGNKIEWVSIKTSDDTHLFADLAGFNDTTLVTASIKQTATINTLSINGNTVTITALFNNQNNQADYYIKTLFLVAKYNGTEFLAGATVANSASTAFRMPAASATEITEFTARPQITVSNSSTISATVDPVAAATNKRVDGLEATLQGEIDDINADKQSLWNTLVNYVTKAGTDTITGVKTFTQTIVGSVTGNAGTATKLATARTIAVTGDVTGSGTFDGSGNLSIATMLGTVPLQYKNEVTQARIDSNGVPYQTLKGRLDANQSTAETALKEERLTGAEVQSARSNTSGKNYDNLKARLDDTEANLTNNMNAKIAQISSVPETFANLSALKSTYPNGKTGLFVTADNGHKYIWANSAWNDAGIYQAVGIAEGTIDTNKLTKVAQENLSSKMLDVEVSPLSQGYKKYVHFDLEKGNIGAGDGINFNDNASVRTSYVEFSEADVVIINKNRTYQYQMYEWDNNGNYLGLTFGYKDNEVFQMTANVNKKYRFVISKTDGTSVDFSDVNVKFALAYQSDALGYSIDNLFKITNGFTLTAGGKQPKFSGLYGAYNMDITMPENNISLYDGYGEFVAKTPDSYNGKVITLPNNNSLIWDTHAGTVFAQPLNKVNPARNVVLAVNSYGDIADGYFSKYFYQHQNTMTFAENYMPYMGGVGYKPDFLVHYNYSIDITLPKDNTFYIVNKSGKEVSKMNMSSQKYTLATKQGLFFDIESATMVI
ncbi:MAG: hypothetical protein ACI4UD_01945, partial [Weissella soli]